MFMGKSSLHKDENEDKHSFCALFLETGPQEKNIKLFLKIANYFA